MWVEHVRILRLRNGGVGATEMHHSDVCAVRPWPAFEVGRDMRSINGVNSVTQCP